MSSKEKISELLKQVELYSKKKELALNTINKTTTNSFTLFHFDFSPTYTIEEEINNIQNGTGTTKK